jgi:LmbE family N-acetylglucosaminyl deacetylase
MKKAGVWDNPSPPPVFRRLIRWGKMKFKLDTAQLFVPDGLSAENALARTTHMAIGAHQDDLEIMAIDGILNCFQQEDKWFTGVVVTNGSGSPRDDLYKNYTDEAMRIVRVKEQKKAAVVGEYAAQVLLDYPSAAVKDGSNKDPVEDIALVLKMAQPEVVYTHNLADKHDTHVGVTLKVIEAIRSLPETERPQHLYGCEVWRDLDWMVDADKVAFNCSAHENLQVALVGVFDSQISGGKRYDLATMGRRRAHATYHASHETDITTGLVFAMDLTPLAEDPAKNIVSYVQECIDRFAQDVRERLDRVQ